MNRRDYYDVLGVSRQADEKAIKAAYRKLARQYHPDVNKATDAEERFKEVNRAYEVLSDPEKRAKYDRFGSDWERVEQAQATGSAWGAAPNGGPGYAYAGDVDLNDLFGGNGGNLNDIFENLFGGAAGRGGSPWGGGFETYTTADRPPRDLETEVEISLYEAYHGTTRLVERNSRRLQVKIPAGARTGTRVRVRGEGQAQGGDLYLRVTVAADPRFEQAGDDLRTTAAVDLYTAVLGGEIPVQTLTGEVKLKIPAGSQNGQTVRLRGKGMPRLKQRDQYGDLLVKLNVQLPRNLSAKQKALFEELRRLG